MASLHSTCKNEVIERDVRERERVAEAVICLWTFILGVRCLWTFMFGGGGAPPLERMERSRRESWYSWRDERREKTHVKCS